MYEPIMNTLLNISISYISDMLCLRIVGQMGHDWIAVPHTIPYTMAPSSNAFELIWFFSWSHAPVQVAPRWLDSWLDMCFSKSKR